MARGAGPISIVLADDDPDDRILVREAPAAIRADGRLRGLPVIMLTTSRAGEDVVASYEEGANSCIAKPVTFPGLVEVMSALDRYWVQVVEMPTGR